MMSCFCPLFKRNRATSPQRDQFKEDIPGTENTKIYTYKELEIATDDFSPTNKLGEGSFGCVYKGKLRDGKVVAVKVLSFESKQGTKEFLTEIITISRIVHENLVKLYGFCAEGTHRILVYDYLENNSLARTLLGSSHRSIQFDWRTRLKICVGIARGLAFLHEEIEPHVVHRDIKAGNILLDKDLTPKISDFGLAKFLPENMTHVSTRVAGTMGYLAPEYAIRGQVTRKSDVYSYGVLLLEIVSGRCNTNSRISHDYQHLLERSPNIMNGFLVLETWALYERGELENVIDGSLTDDLDVEEACRFLKVGLMCTQDSMKLRPSMSAVVRMLSGDEDVDSKKITEPGIINDFMDLKVISSSDAGPVNKPSTRASYQDGSSLSLEDINTSTTFTAISK